MILTPEQFDAAYDRLPYTIREFLAGEEVANVTQAIGQKYGLHVDTLGALDREISNMLLGLISPTQFVGELRSAGIPAESITPIAQEVNEKIFLPLHKRMQEPGAAAQPETRDEATHQEVARNFELPTQSIPVPPIQPPPIIPPPVPVPARYVPPSPPPTPPVVQQPQQAAPVALPDARTMAGDIQMVKSGGFHAEPPAAAPVPAPLPASAPMRAPVPPAPRAPLPPPPPMPTAPPISADPVMPKTQSPQSENRSALHEVLKSYGVDPYREPAE